MEENEEDLIKDFKSKVEEAISVLPQIPESQHDEVWTYWQVISVAVKAAVGGRGPIVAKQMKVGPQRGRPRGKTCLNGQHKKLFSGSKIRSICKGFDDIKKSNSKEKLLANTELSHPLNEPELSGAEYNESSYHPKISDQVASQKQHCTDSPETSDHLALSTFLNAETSTEHLDGGKNVSKLSRKDSNDEPTEIKFDTEPVGLLANTLTTNKVEISDSDIQTHEESSVDPPNPLATKIVLAPQAVKRKRGRPPKCAVPPSQNLIVPPTPVCHNTEITNLEDPSPQECLENKMAVTGKSISSKGTLQHSIKSIITGLDLEKNKCKDNNQFTATYCRVRRSERRIAPNRDKLFCYFDQMQKVMDEEEQEEDVSSNLVDTAEKLVEDVKQETRDMKMKTEAEKVQERTCHVCQAILMSASSMAAHMRIHTGERPFACPVCHKTFTTKGNCERHEVTHVGLKAFTCTRCSKKFTEKKSLKIHMRRHTGERPYGCNICGTRFFQTGTLKTHMDRHTGHKSHLCELCGKAFRQGCQLRVHMRRHAKDMPFHCQYCYKRFYTKSDMERHVLKHTGERPFSCDECSETFTRLQYLRDHQNTHLKRHIINPYKCVSCGLSFQDFTSCHHHVNKHKMPTAEQPVQQIHVEVTPDTTTQQVMEQVQVILNQQHLEGYQTAEIQTLVHLTSDSNTSTHNIISTSCTSNQPSAHNILNKLVLGVEDSAEIYHVTLVDSSQYVSNADNSTVQTVTAADFSAINLLASATTQLSLPQ